MLAERKQIYTTPPEIEKARAQEKKQELHVVPRSDRRQRTAIAILMSVCFLIFAVCFAYVAVESKIYNVGYAINEVRGDISAMKSKSERVALEIDYLASMERIEPLAMALGMTYPETADKIFVAYAPAGTEPAAVAAEEAIEIEVIEAEENLSLGSRILQVIGSLFGGHFGIEEN